MIPQIAQRKIGNVTILDIKGSFSGSWALRGREKLKQALGTMDLGKVIFNLRETTGLDTLGAKCLLESLPVTKEAGILYGNVEIMEFVNRFPESERFRRLHSEEEIVSAFGQDLVVQTGPNEQRTSDRIETAFPLKFDYEEDGEKKQFKAIVTNLSEGGLFAEYIDLKVAEESLNHLDPSDLKLLYLKLLLPNRKPIFAEGKVVYRKLDGEQVGIGIQFFEVGSREQKEIGHFLKLHGFEKKMLNQSQERMEN